MCGVEEHDELIELQRACLPLDKPYDTTRGWWWLGTVDGVAVAFAGLTPTWADPRIGYLCRAGVVRDMRGHGIQKRLIRLRLLRARRLGMYSAVTDTTAANLPSANSLISCGFRLYDPATRWAADGALYWRRAIEPLGGWQ